jgi:hypothetical protein
MFLRCHQRKKNGKPHRYWSVVESRRLSTGQSAQRQLLYLGEINDSQEAAWRKTIEVFDENEQEPTQACLFPADRPIPPHEVNALSLLMSEVRLLRPRSFGGCWLGCRLWRELQRDTFRQQKLGGERGAVAWERVLQLLAVNRLCEPASEFMAHRRWFDGSAMDELLGRDFAVAEKGRLYRRLDRVPPPHKDGLCRHLTQRWKTLFDASFDVLRYDLTSTYFEGSCEQIPKAKHGYGRDGRGDCRQVVIALVVTPDGLRSDGRQHRRQIDACPVSGEDPIDVRQGPPRVGDGPRHSHRSNAREDAPGADRPSRRHAQNHAEQNGVGAGG